MVVKSDAVVLRQHYPVSCTDVSKPFLVFRVLRKMIVVNFYFCTGLTKCVGDGLFAERAVDEENKIIKRL